jgi:hypothetical protein
MTVTHPQRIHTPWGYSDHVEYIAEGIQWVSTPSHGGYKLSPERVKAMPRDWLNASFNLQGFGGWFEEDCDWCLVVLAFPDCFEPSSVGRARQCFTAWIEPKITQDQGDGGA